MLPMIHKKLREVRDENFSAMMANTYDANVAAGRYACSVMLLNGGTPEDAEQGLDILPSDWPQRRGWQETIKQFKGLI